MHICITGTKISQSNFSPCNEPRYPLFSFFFNFLKNLVNTHQIGLNTHDRVKTDSSKNISPAHCFPNSKHPPPSRLCHTHVSAIFAFT